MPINNIGYPFVKTNKGLFNPVSSIEENIKSKLLNLLATVPGLRVIGNNCEFGVDLSKLLFLNRHDLNSIKAKLEYSIKRWIPEINMVSVLATRYLHSIKISINFQVGRLISSVHLEYKINEH